jgi:hypothetical protein
MASSIVDKSRRNDRLAAWIIKAGGLFVIVAVIGILFLIAKVSLPLFYSPTAEKLAEVPVICRRWLLKTAPAQARPVNWVKAVLSVSSYCRATSLRCNASWLKKMSWVMKRQPDSSTAG